MSLDIPRIDAKAYMDPGVRIVHEDPGAQDIGALERYAADMREGRISEAEVPPIVLYAGALDAVRQLSGKSKTNAEQMAVARELSDRLGHVANTLGLPEDHFSINTSGDPLIVQEGDGEHVILPTHFEGGSYFNNPHADHQLGYAPEQVPKIDVGKYVRFGGRVGFNAGGDVKLGDGVWLAPDSYVLCQDHSGYERPSVGSRTAGATRLPGIEFGDYAMVGRKSVIKWDVGYVGKGAVVALLSGIGKEVGDYSIVGNQDKILGYQAYRGALLELAEENVSLEDALRIPTEGWKQLKADWKRAHGASMEGYSCTEALPAVKEALRDSRAFAKRPTMLDMNPGTGNSLLEASHVGIAATGVSASRETFPTILQRAEDARTNHIRLRGNVQPGELPYPNGGVDILRNKTSGFDVVVNVERDPTEPIDESQQQLREASRVTTPDGTIVFGYKQEGATGELVKYASNELGLSLDRETTQHDNDGRQHQVLVFSKQ